LCVVCGVVAKIGAVAQGMRQVREKCLFVFCVVAKLLRMPLFLILVLRLRLGLARLVSVAVGMSVWRLLVMTMRGGVIVAQILLF
jgi:hypothetical protein